jgi:AcrR family transcriptional regulator
MPKRG